MKKSWGDAVDASKDVAAGFAVAGAAAGAFGLTALKAAANQEQTIIAFETMLGSAEKAASFYKDLVDFAARTPFELKGLEQSSKQLLAYGFTQEEVLPNLRALGDIAAGVGMDKLPNLILAFGQVKAATKLTGMELRQFTEAGVPLLDELAKIMDKPVAAIQEMVSAGEIGFPVVQQAMQNLTGEGGRFENLMDKQSKTLGGMWSNLQDTWEQFLRGEGARFIEWAKQFIEIAIDIAQNKLPEWIKKMEELGNWFERNKNAIAILAGVITAVLIPALVAGAAAIGKIFLALTVGNPWGLAIGAIVALATAIYLNWDTIKAKTIEIWNAITDFVSGVWNEIVSTAQSIWGGIKDFFGGVWEGIKEVFKFGAALAVGLVIEYFNLFGIDIVATMQTIISALQVAWTTIQAAFSSALGMVQNVWNAVWTAISGFISPIWEGIKTVVGDAWQWISDKFNEFAEPISDVWTSMWNALSDVFESVWEGIKNTFKGAINFIIKGINSVVNALNSITRAGSKTLGMSVISLPTIPMLAEGGIVNRPTLAMIGEAGPEAVVPLSRAFNPAPAYAGATFNVYIQGGYYLDRDAADEIGDKIMEKLKKTMKL